MAENRRALLKPTSTDKLKESASEDDQYVNSGKGGEFHKFEHGINNFRLYPKHPKEKAFYKLVGSHWGTIEGEDGKPQRRKIPNGKLHGGLSKSLIAAYIELAGHKLDGDDADEKGKLDALVDNKDGIQMKTSWVCYADKIVNKKPTFGVLEFKKTVRDRINEESNIDGAEDAITIDPFTDPEDGKLLIVDFDSKAKSANKYYKSIRVGKTAYPLSDEQVDYFLDDVKPLSKLGIFQYGEREFETELEIIKYADDANEINLYDSDEFQAIVKALKKELKNRKSTTPVEGEAPKKKKPVVEDEDEAPAPKKSTKDEFDGMDRDELKEYIVEHELALGVKKAWDDDELRNQIRAIVKPKKKVPPVVEEEDDEDTPPPPKKKKPVAEDEDDDVPPPPKKKKPTVEDDEDAPAPKKAKKQAVEDDEEDDEKPKVDLKKIKAKLREADDDED